MKLFLISTIFITLLQIYLYKIDFSDKFNLIIYDFISKVIEPNTLPKDNSVVIVEIDEKSLNYFGQWPWPRVLTAQLIDTITETHPNSIAMDVIFPEYDRTSPNKLIEFYKEFYGLDIKIEGLPESLNSNDEFLAEIMQSSRVILPTVLLPNPTYSTNCNIKTLPKFKGTSLLDRIYHYPYSLCNLEIFQNGISENGFINAYLDSDGYYRRVPLFIKYNNEVVPTLTLPSLLRVFSNIEINDEVLLYDLKLSILGKNILMDEKSQVLLNFYPQEWYKKVSALDVLSGNFKREDFIGKSVLIGATAIGLHDHYTIRDGKQLAGIYMHATLIENFFNDDLRVEPTHMREFALLTSLLISIAMLALLIKNRFAITVIVFILFSLIELLKVSYFLKSGLYISSGYFYFPFVVTFIILMVLYIFISFVEKRNFYKRLSIKLENRVRERTEDLLEAKMQIEELYQMTQDSIKLASLIQKALIPNRDLFEHYFEDYFILWEPRDMVGGDIYFFEEVKEGDIAILMVIDCTGHGVPGAFVTMLVKAVEREISTYIDEEITPAKILSEFNSKIKHLLKQYSKDSISDVGFDGGIICYNRKKQKLTYAGANTPLFIIKDKKVEVVKGSKHSIGYVRSKLDYEFKNIEIDIKDIDGFYLSSDGYLDQVGGDKGFPFGKKRFQALIEEIFDEDCIKQQDIVMEELNKYQANRVRIDDVTVIGAKFK